MANGGLAQWALFVLRASDASLLGNLFFWLIVDLSAASRSTGFTRRREERREGSRAITLLPAFPAALFQFHFLHLC
jgi:hypothetical protein